MWLLSLLLYVKEKIQIWDLKLYRFVCLKDGKLVLIMFMQKGEDGNNDGDVGTSQFPLYNGLYKVLESMTKDYIITEVM